MADTSWAWQDGWENAWQPVIDLVGEDFSEGEKQPAADLVERASIRRYLEPLEFGCPLHFDEAVATANGYRGILAPYSGISQTWTDQGQWHPGQPTNYPTADPNANGIRRAAAAQGRAVPSPETSAAFATDIEIEYFEPVCVGDHLTYSGRKLLSVVPRETSVGRGAFMVWQREVHNQHGELVAQLRNGGYQYVPKPRAEGAATSTAAAPAGPAGPIMAPAPAPHAEGVTPQPADWASQRYFEDVSEGDEVPPVIFTMTVFRLVVEAGANRDFNQIHHNTPVTQAQGAPDMYANNVFIQGMWERTVREYIGLQGRFKKTGPFRMRIFNNVGETVVTKGTVKRKWVEGGEHLVELEIVSEHSRGISVGPGPVVVSLPSRG
jgi:acyl dehydratase